jgi:hypothetical protein
MLMMAPMALAGWEGGAYREALEVQSIVPVPAPVPRPPNAAGIRGANEVGLRVDIVVVNQREAPQNRFWFGQEIRFLFDSGPEAAWVYIFGIGTGGEILYASNSNSPVSPGIKRYPPDELLLGPHGPISAAPPVGVSTFQIVVSRQPLEVLRWQRWIAPPDRPPVPVGKLLTVVEILPLKYGAENVGFDFVQFCAEPPGGDFRGCPLGEPESLRLAVPLPPPLVCSLQQFDQNRNGLLDDPEFFDLIDAWVRGACDHHTFFQGVEFWVSQTPLGVVVIRSLPGQSLVLRRLSSGFQFVVQGASRLHLEIFDSAGRQLWQGKTLGSRLNWAPDRRLASGVYLALITARVDGQWQRWIRRVVIKICGRGWLQPAPALSKL